MQRLQFLKVSGRRSLEITLHSGTCIFVAVNVKSRRGRWLKPPSRSDSHPRGIFFVLLGWAGQHTVYGMGQRSQSNPALHNREDVDTA